MKNFPFEHDGQILWYSRSVAVSNFVFAKDKNNELHILITKRGKSAGTAPDEYCVPGGFLDFDEDLLTCCVREIHEETGLCLDRKLMNFWNINSIPNISDRQTVIIMYYAILPGFLEDYELTTEYSEPDEIQEVMFMPVSALLTSDINFAFNNRQIILDIYNKRCSMMNTSTI